METEELIKLVDGIYKNILDKFNPGARQMINAGKAYLKALHGAAAASRLYVDAISKLARQAQQGTWGGSSDIGAALMKIVEVYKEIQDQQMNILKAFYVDLLVPLETNLEKDTKVVQSEQKRFLQQHKQRSETYSKAAAMMKKQRKKSRTSTKTGLAMDKELKNMQVLEEEKTKLDAFCEQSLKNAMTQERRRYGFVLERQCSLAKHYLSYHSYGVLSYQQNIEKWTEVAKTREYLPESVENIFTNRLRQISVWQDDDLYSNPRSPNLDDDRISINSQLRKTKSMDASCLDIRSIGEVNSPVTTLNRAKSEYNLNSSTHTLIQECQSPSRRPKSMAVPPPPQWEAQLARALYAYLSGGENQLTFLEGDLIALIGDRTKGWQFGENLRTQSSGWFPLAYTEVLDDPTISPAHRNDGGGSSIQQPYSSGGSANNTPTSGGMGSNPGGPPTTPSAQTCDSPPTPRMFGDTLHLHRSSNNAKQIRRAIGSNNIPPPGVPAPVPTPSLPRQRPTGLPQSQSAQFSTAKQPHTHDADTYHPHYQTQVPQITGMKTSSSFNFSTHPAPSTRPIGVAPLPLHLQARAGGGGGGSGKAGGPVGTASLHSSNDSGFSNDPPPQPEIDYSDDDSIPGNVQTKLSARHRSSREINSDDNNNTLRKNVPMRQAASHGSLVDNRFYMSDDPEILMRERKNLVKRTKSFWKFGKNNSDNEILEGMSLWRHRDLVDVEEKEARNNKKAHSKQKERKPSRDKSNDSDRTINAAQNNEIENIKPTKYKQIEEKEAKYKQKANTNTKQKTKKPPPERKDSDTQSRNNESNYDVSDINNDDQFYDDDGDGLMMKTVNRKDILLQYTNNSTGSETETDSDVGSDDPYDCILVEDQNVDKSDNFPNVAEIGKKLEKLSKTSKYPPTKENNKNTNQIRNNVEEKNIINIRKANKNNMERKPKEDNNDINHYKENKNSFTSFGFENGESLKKNKLEHNKQYQTEKQYKKINDSVSQETRNRQYAEVNKKGAPERRPRPSYESIDSDIDHVQEHRKKNNRIINTEIEKRDKRTINNNNNYYDSTNDEFSDAVESRKFLPRTKLTKSNSHGSGKNEAQDTESSLMEYGETLQRRLKNLEYQSKFEKMSKQNGGNMYGPWYDLWGLDASARK